MERKPRRRWRKLHKPQLPEEICGRTSKDWNINYETSKDIKSDRDV